MPFGEWLPDLAATGNPGTTAANGVIATADGYAPLASLSVQSDALDERCQGAAAVQDDAGNVYVYAGDDTDLYSLTDGAFSKVSKSTGAYSTAEQENWEFAEFGNTFIATNYADPVQGITPGGSAFADLITSTNKPKARHIAVVREFVVLGNTNDNTDGQRPYRVWWSAIDDATNYDISASTQCDYDDTPDAGWCQKLVGGVEYGLIFFEKQISRMTYAGSPIVFQIDPIDRRRGTPIPNSVVGWGRLVFFISEEGFMVTDGQQTQPIGQNKVDKTFWNQFNTTYLSRVSAAIDPLNKVVMWAFPGTGSTTDANKLYMYNWVDRKWSEADVDTQLVFQARNQGETLESLDNISGSLDTLPFPLDSRAYTGGELRLGAINTSNRLAFFNGSNLAATLETTELDMGMRGKVTRLRPVVDGGTVTAALASRARTIDSATFGSAGSMNANGDVTLISEGRYHRARVSVAAGGTWTKAQGVGMVIPQTGRK